MSGLAGVFFRDGRTASSDVVDRMVSSMSYRGPDGINVWQHDQIALGQCTLRSSRFSEPAIGPDTNNERYVIVGDVRLDNRESLLRACGNPTRDNPAATSDLSLVKLLFEIKGEPFVDLIEGDFAFSVYDIKDRQLHNYRDHFGTRPFYYSLDDDHFVFASDIKAILATGLVEPHVDSTKLEDYLVGNLVDQERTFYRRIRRLPAGSTLRVGPDSVEQRKFWSIDKVTQVDGDDAKLVAEFRTRFLNAVDKRLCSNGSTAFMLSGGLDSSSVVASAAYVARDSGHSFQTYSVEFPYLPDHLRARTDERRYVDAVVERSHVDSSRLTGEVETPLSSLSTMLQIHDEPFLVPNAYLDAIALSAVHDDGHKVLLTGLEGDLTISHGDGYLNELGYAGRWDEFVRESHSLANRTESDPELFFDRYAVPTLEKLAIAGKWGIFRDGIRSLSSVFDHSTGGLYWRLAARPYLVRLYHKISRAETLDDTRALRFIRDSYPDRSEIRDRIRKGSARMDSAMTQFDIHISQLESGYSASLLEFAEKNAAHWQVDVRHPFFDRRLVEYSVSLPGRTKLSDGWTRYIMRASMEQILPDAVRWRAQKAALGPNFTYLMGKEPEGLIRSLAERAIESFPYIIDKTSVNSLLDRKKYATLWKVLVLGDWVLHNRA